MPEEPSTRERIITEAFRLFAEHGFQATKVADIEAAAGMTPRGGSFYKHFESKEAVLGAGLARHAQRVETLESVFDLLPLGDARAEVILLARWTLRELGRERDLLRLLQNEGGRLPEVAEYRDRFVQLAYRGCTEWMRRHVREGTLPADFDPEAATAIILGAVVNYRVEEALFGKPPPGPDEDGFIAALVELWSALTRSAPGGDSTEAG